MIRDLAVMLVDGGECVSDLGAVREQDALFAVASDSTAHKTVLDRALQQIPAEYVKSLEILVRADSAGATHGLVDYRREASMRFSVGYELTEQVRAAILQIPEDAWVVALDQDGSERRTGRSVRSPTWSICPPGRRAPG